MRSLTLKLTLAFLLVGLVGAILVAVLVAQQTRTEFDRFRQSLEQDQALMVSALGDYYRTKGSWDGVDGYLASSSLLSFPSRGMALLNADRLVIIGNRPFPTGQTPPLSALDNVTPVTVNGQTVGYVSFDPRAERPPGGPGDNPRGGGNGPPGGPTPDTQFLQRVTWASAISAAIAALMALALGVLLARSLTRPIRELTAATRIMASGRFDQRVTVRSRDEIGQLAESFNHMSADLERASQARKQMTADLAHDLRTPLSILRGYTEGLQDGRIQGSPALYAVMHGEVEHLQRLVEDLRLLSLADAGELPLNRRAVDPRALLERTGLAYMVQAQAQGVALGVEAPDDLPSIYVDTDRMTQVLNNLVSNALRHTAQGGVMLSAAADGGSVQLRVSDTGSGIAPDDLPFVFDRLYRVDKARQRTDDTSSGLGLAIAKAIVEAHGGAISVASARGQGTTFTISLPTGDGVTGSAARPSAQNHPSLGSRVTQIQTTFGHLRGSHSLSIGRFHVSHWRVTRASNDSR
ncbi:MAG: ATP-binding protein [Anaerolineae bacterium]